MSRSIRGIRISRHRRYQPQLETLEGRCLLTGGIDLSGVEWRTIDGTGNNVALPTQGAAETRQIRFGYGAQFGKSPARRSAM